MHWIYSLKKYAIIALAFAVVYTISSQFSELIQHFVENSGEEGYKLLLFSTVIVVFSIGFFVYYLAKSTFIPSFVLVIFFGFAAQDLLTPLLNHAFIVNILVTLGAIFILFSGGLETPFKNFRRLFRYIFSLAFIGVVITSLMLSFTIYIVALLIGFELSLPAIILLGTALASTDPASIIPAFQGLLFSNNNRVKYIAISESALNDVVGAIMTIVFLHIFQNEEVVATTFWGAYSSIFTLETAIDIGKHAVIGVVVGLAGFAVLEFWNRFKIKIKTQEETDVAFFIIIPFLVYTVSSVLGGSGFLSAFLSALFFRLSDHIKHVEHYFNNTIKAFMKPMIFIILGSLINLQDLIEYAPVGITVALLFMFVLRPLLVLITLAPFNFTKHKLDFGELIFLSFVRETGVIPAVLLVTLAGSGVAGAEAIVPIGMWVILLTLLIQPPLTPLLAKTFKVATEIKDTVMQTIGGGTESTAVLVSRGHSFARRLPHVAEWAQQHNINNIALIYSPEQEYTDEFVAEKQASANAVINEINKGNKSKNLPNVQFEFLAEKGYLQDNIKRYISSHQNISIIFAGKKMLDFRSNEIKNLPVPFLFID